MRRTLVRRLGVLLLAGAGLAVVESPTSAAAVPASEAVCLQPFLDVSDREWRERETAGEIQFDPGVGNYRIYWLSEDGARKQGQGQCRGGGDPGRYWRLRLPLHRSQP